MSSVKSMQSDPRFQLMQRMASVRRRPKKSSKGNYIKFTGGLSAQELMDKGINLETGKPTGITSSSTKSRRRPPSITAGVSPRGGDFLNPNIYASKEDKKEAFRQGISLGQLYTNQNRYIDETGMRWNDMKKKFATPKSERNWTYNYANGLIPNADAARDAVRREIGAGLNRNQIQVHAVTNTRDEPRGLKDVPNYAAGEGAKEMLDILRDIFNEISTLNSNNAANQEQGGQTESTVRHINSPLNINVSGNIQETNSNIDEQIFNAVVKAVEKLRGGVPVSPPKAPQNETGI